MTTNRPLRVFLCHSSNDKAAVRELYQQLCAEPWIKPWLDEEELYPGQDWNLEIEKAVEAADVIIVCLSKGSTTKEGYVQREIRIALDYADYKPEGTLYIIPVRLEECEPPRRLRNWQYADYFSGQRERAIQRLLVSLKRRVEGLGLMYEVSTTREMRPTKEKQWVSTGSAPKPAQAAMSINIITLSNGMELLRVPAGKFLMGSKTDNQLAFDSEKPQHIVDLSYDYCITRFPVTNELYDAYVKSKGIKHPAPGWDRKKDHPVTHIKWIDAMGYCQWLNHLFKNELPLGLVFRLPTEAEWEKAARGTDGREFPWDNEFDRNKCNTFEGGNTGTTSVWLYSPRSDSLYGCADMVGNVWEWTHSLMEAYPYNATDGREDENASGARVVRGGSFALDVRAARCACRVGYDINPFSHGIGFRVVASPELF